MAEFVDKEEKIRCPYDPHHLISRKRMETHITTCRLNHPKAKLAECKYNINHKIRYQELQMHHEQCPDRKHIEHMRMSHGESSTEKYPIQNIDVTCGESWDDCNDPNYDPKKYAENAEVLRRLDVVSPKCRRDFRREERARINQLSSRNRPVMSTIAGLPETSTSGASAAAEEIDETEAQKDC